MKRFNTKNDLKNFLDEMYIKYNKESFIEKDPIQIPYIFSLKEDIEISAFLTSIIAWGEIIALKDQPPIIKIIAIKSK